MHFDNAREARDEEYVRPYKRKLVDVFVSKETLSDALDLAGALFTELEDAGIQVMLAPSSGRFGHVAAEVRPGQKAVNDYDASRRWCPSHPTIAVSADVPIGLTLFEVSEEVDVRYDSGLHKYVRTAPPRQLERLLPRGRRLAEANIWISKRWMPSGRLGLHAFAPQPDVQWEHYWYESKKGELRSKFGEVVATLTAAAGRVRALVQEAELRRQEEQRKWEAKQEIWRRQEEEERRRREAQQRHDAEARREADYAECVRRWRLAGDIRAYVAANQALVEQAGLHVTEGGAFEQESEWALAYAERLDPLTSLRREIEKVKGDHGGELFEVWSPGPPELGGRNDARLVRRPRCEVALPAPLERPQEF